MPNSRDIILRIDRVGSFRLILSDQIILGGPAAKQEQGVVRILASLSSSHARIRRHAGGYSIEPLRGSVQLGSQVETSANNESRLLIEETYWGNKTQAMLSPEIGANLDIASLLCQSATLNITPANRLVDQLDGLVLMESMILLGPGKNMHITCGHWQQSGALIFRDNSFRFCTPLKNPGVNIQSQGQSNQETTSIDQTLQLNQHYCFDEIGFYLEG